MLKCGYSVRSKSFSGDVACVNHPDHWQTWAWAASVYVAANRLRNALIVMQEFLLGWIYRILKIHNHLGQIMSGQNND